MTQSNSPPRPDRPALNGSTPLALAYAAFHRTAPSELEVNAAVERLHTRLHTTRQQPARLRRFKKGPYLACAAIFLGAVAYAAGSLGGRVTSNSSAPGNRAPTSSPPEPANPRKPSIEARAPANIPSVEPKAPSMPGAAPAPARRAEATPAHSTRGPAQPPTSAQPASSARGVADWGGVAEAMASNDYARAERALAELAQSDSRDTRVNAKLGQAQLALGRGDCAEARRLSTSVLQSAPSALARRRALEVLSRCSADSGSALR